MPGPEQHLGAYMLALAQQTGGGPNEGKALASSRLEDTRNGRRKGEPFADFWRRQPHHFPQESGAAFRGGSVNIGCMLWSVGLWHPATREQAIREALWWFDANRRHGFELSEPGARVREYRTWTLISHPLALRWCRSQDWTTKAGGQSLPANPLAAQIEDEARDWLAFFWSKYALTSVITPDGPMCIECGARSQGAGLYRLKYDYAASIAFGLPWRWRARPHELTDKFWRKDWEIKAADLLREEIVQSAAGGPRAMAEEVMAGRAPVVHGMVPQYPTLLSEQHIVRYADGSLVVWNGDGTDRDAVPGGNTAGLGAVGWEGQGSGDWPARMWSLPVGGGVRIRDKQVREVCWWEDRYGTMQGSHFTGRPARLVYHQQIEGGAVVKSEQPLPGADIVYHVRHGRNGMEVVA